MRGVSRGSRRADARPIALASPASACRLPSPPVRPVADPRRRGACGGRRMGGSTAPGWGGWVAFVPGGANAPSCPGPLPPLPGAFLPSPAPARSNGRGAGRGGVRGRPCRGTRRPASPLARAVLGQGGQLGVWGGSRDPDVVAGTVDPSQVMRGEGEVGGEGVAGRPGTSGRAPKGKGTSATVVSGRFESVPIPCGRRTGQRGGVVFAEGS